MRSAVRRAVLIACLIATLLIPSTRPQGVDAACFGSYSKYVDYALTGGGYTHGVLRISISWCTGYIRRYNGLTLEVTSMTASANLIRTGTSNGLYFTSWLLPNARLDGLGKGLYHIHWVEIKEDMLGPDIHWATAMGDCDLAIVYPSGTMTKGNCSIGNIGRF
jgi:hypothetical protein